MVDGVPGYVRLAAMLRDKIRSGELPIGSFTPSQHELETGLGISRGMAGEALKMLAHEGLVRSRRGVGTQVIAVPEKLPSIEVEPGVEITARMPRPGEDADPAVPLLVITRPGEPDEVHPAGRAVILTVPLPGGHRRQRDGAGSSRHSRTAAPASSPLIPRQPASRPDDPADI